MLPVFDEKLFVNRIVDVQLPTKGEIFSRVGGHAVNPAGSYTGDESAKMNRRKTEQAMSFIEAVEAYQKPSNETGPSDE